MAALLRENDSLLIVERLIIADTFWCRLRGLIGQQLTTDVGLWIRPCRSIHTFAMGYSIDVVFIDSTLEIVGLAPRIPTWRVRLAPRETRSTIELAAGRIEQLQLRTGNRLVVINQANNEIVQ